MSIYGKCDNVKHVKYIFYESLLPRLEMQNIFFRFAPIQDGGRGKSIMKFSKIVIENIFL